MDQAPLPARRSVLLSFRFLGPTLVGSLAMALVCTFAPLAAQLAILGALISTLGGLFLAYLEQEEDRERRRTEQLERLSVPLTLAPEHELYDQYVAFSRALVDLAAQSDPILREIAVLKLSSVNGQIESLADGTVVFAGTEAWRTVYEKLLGSNDIRDYRSVALVRTKDYWQDPPGRQSMQVNFDAAYRGLLVERIIILRNELWPKGAHLPVPEILPWIEDQHNHGLWVCLVRESELTHEADLLTDIGIYGDRALGTQELDERCRTLRFVLQFDPQAVRLAKDRWKRLLVYTTSFQRLLDRLPTEG